MPWYGGYPMGFAMLWWILGIGLFIVAVVACTRRLTFRSGTSGETPDQILKRRYASGEIDRETYQRMLADLRT